MAQTEHERYAAHCGMRSKRGDTDASATAQGVSVLLSDLRLTGMKDTHPV